MTEDPNHPTEDIDPSRDTENHEARLDRYQYADEKLTTAIYRLATGEGSIKARLMESFIEIDILSEQHFPEELRALFRDIKKILTKNPPRTITAFIDGKFVNVSSGRAGATIPYMRIKTAVAVAEKIFGLYSRLSEWLRMNDQ